MNGRGEGGRVERHHPKTTFLGIDGGSEREEAKY